MAHDFGIRELSHKDWAFFFGYANGLMYRAFGEEKHALHFSGDNSRVVKTKAETVKALDKAISEFDSMNYPDPTRLDEIKKFRKDIENDDERKLYEIWFS